MATITTATARTSKEIQAWLKGQGFDLENLKYPQIQLEEGDEILENAVTAFENALINGVEAHRDTLNTRVAGGEKGVDLVVSEAIKAVRKAVFSASAQNKAHLELVAWPKAFEQGIDIDDAPKSKGSSSDDSADEKVSL